MGSKRSIADKILLSTDCEESFFRSLPRPLIFTNGVFDIIHRGHVTYLEDAAKLGATLLVAINTDTSVKTLGKGEDRPINTEKDRAAVLAALSSVDWVTFFSESTPERIIRLIQPDYIVKGGDYDMELLPETQIVRSWGGDAKAIPIEYERSTSKILQKIRSHP